MLSTISQQADSQSRGERGERQATQDGVVSRVRRVRLEAHTDNCCGSGIGNRILRFGYFMFTRVCRLFWLTRRYHDKASTPPLPLPSSPLGLSFCSQVLWVSPAVINFTGMSLPGKFEVPSVEHAAADSRANFYDADISSSISLSSSPTFLFVHTFLI